MVRLIRLSAVALALCVVAAACSDQDAVTPRMAVDGGPLATVKNTPVDVDVLQRNRPLATDLRESAVIGRSGGRIEIREAGIRVDFPSNALRANTRITVTALAGSNVAYVFEPHGITFQQNVIIRQDFKGTNAKGNKLIREAMQGAYFADADYVGRGHAKILETLPTSINLDRDKVRFGVSHFSGYLVSTGRRGGYITSTGNRIPSR